MCSPSLSPQYLNSSSYTHLWSLVIQPHEWAAYARPPGVGSGDQQLEAYHHRLQSIIKLPEAEGNSLSLILLLITAIDHLADALYKEWQVVENTIKTPFLLQEKRQQHHTAAEKHAKKRQTLHSYVPNLYVLFKKKTLTCL